MKLRMPSLQTLLRVSAVLTIVALAFMVWSLFVPTPMPVMLAMSVGQGLGILAFMLYGVAIYLDLRRERRETSMRLQKIPENDAKPVAAEESKS